MTSIIKTIIPISYLLFISIISIAQTDSTIFERSNMNREEIYRSFKKSDEKVKALSEEICAIFDSMDTANDTFHGFIYSSAQNVWYELRNKKCEIIGSKDAPDVSNYYYTCMTEENIKRSKELEVIISQLKNLEKE